MKVATKTNTWFVRAMSVTHWVMFTAELMVSENSRKVSELFMTLVSFVDFNLL